MRIVDYLNEEGALAENSVVRLANDGKGIGQYIVERLAPRQVCP